MPDKKIIELSHLNVVKEYISDVMPKVPGDIGAVSTNDSRLSDARTPLSHASTHVKGGSDEITITSNQVSDFDSRLSSKADASSVAGMTQAISWINERIPSQATASNRLADKAFVNSSIQTATANFRGNWETWADVPTDPSRYPADYAGSTTPTVNDYLVVQENKDYPVIPDEALEYSSLRTYNIGDTVKYNNKYWRCIVEISTPEEFNTEHWILYYTGTWRFKYSGTWSGLGKSGWYPEYRVNEKSFTAAQLAVLDSEITQEKRIAYDEHIASSSNPHNVTKEQLNLSNVEDKSSEMIRDELTSSNVTTALGFTPMPNTFRELFVCTYGETSYSDIIDAIEENKLPVVADISDGITRIYTGTRSNTDAIYFSCQDFTTNRRIMLSSDNVWTRQSSSFYVKPTTGIPASDLASGVQSTLSGAAMKNELSTVATSGSYNDLSNKPYESIGSHLTLTDGVLDAKAQTQADWNTTNTSYVSYIRNKPVVHNITISTLDPSGGSDGDVWIKYEA